MTDEEIRRYLDPDVVSTEIEFLKTLYERVVALERATVPLVTETSGMLPVLASTPTASTPESPRHSLVFIVNGEEVNYPVTPGMPMSHARNAVLASTGNTGRPPGEWDIRDVYGNLVSPDAIAASFAYEQRFFCTIRVGAGGAP